MLDAHQIYKDYSFTQVSAREETKLRIDDMHRILSDVQEMKGKQENFSGTLESIQR